MKESLAIFLYLLGTGLCLLGKVLICVGVYTGWFALPLLSFWFIASRPFGDYRDGIAMVCCWLPILGIGFEFWGNRLRRRAGRSVGQKIGQL